MRTWEDYKAHVKAQGKGEKENMNKLFQGGRAFLLWFLWFFWQRWPSPPHPFLFLGSSSTTTTRQAGRWDAGPDALGKGFSYFAPVETCCGASLTFPSCPNSKALIL